MKRSICFVLAVFFVLNALQAAAEVTSIYDYIRKIDNNYYVVVGINGKSGDSLAATDIVVALKKQLNRDIEPTYETMVNPSVNKILLGHPCDNTLIQGLSCEKWPYDEGLAVIKIIGNDLVLAGSTVDDTRRAAKVIAHFKDFPELKEYKELLVLGTTLEVEDIKLQPIKPFTEFICGDGLCEVGEKHLCQTNCEQVNCYTLCQVKKFGAAACRDPLSNPNLPFCLQGEANQGTGYCGEGKVCCCKEFEQDEATSQPTPDAEKVVTPTRRSIWSIIWTWFKEVSSVMF